jgi:hypothetical protein
MSEGNNRDKALAAALVGVSSGDTTSKLVERANAFLTFLNGGAPATAPATMPATTAPAKPKPAATKPKPAAAKPVVNAEVADVDLKKLVGDKVNELLKANKRTEAVDLLASFDSQSASGIVSQGEDVITAFMTQADEILASAEGGLAD